MNDELFLINTVDHMVESRLLLALEVLGQLHVALRVAGKSAFLAGVETQGAIHRLQLAR